MADSSIDSSIPHQPARRRWNAFVCQDCRAVFRIPSDYHGKGVVCPQCDRMLRIPQAGESIPALVQPANELGHVQREVMTEPEQIDQKDITHPIESPTAPSEAARTLAKPTPAMQQETQRDPSLRRRKKRRERTHDAESEWVKNPARRLKFSQRASYRSWWVASSLLVVVLGIIFIFLMIDRNRSGKTSDVTATTQNPVTPQVLTIQTQTKALEAKKKQIYDIKSALANAENFLSAQEIPAMLEWIRGGAKMKDRVTQFYQNQPFRPDPTYKIDRSSAVLLANGKAFQVILRNAEKVSRAMVLIKENEKFLVDWESWVGWSEMSYAEIKKQKPLKPTEVRVIVSLESYYNFDFPSSAESDWQSYRLDFPGEEKFLYGYVRRDDPLINQLRPIASDSNGAMILRIRYVESNSHDTQVVIDSVVSDSWIKAMPKSNSSE
jgi:hypothetical protein